MSLEWPEKISDVIKWLLGVVVAALIGMGFNWIPNPFLPGDCIINDERYNFDGAKVRLFYSPDKKALATAFEEELNTCGLIVVVADNNFYTKSANIRYYMESDSVSADAIKKILNSVAAKSPSMNVRFELNSRIEYKEKDRTNVFHAYF